MHESRRGTSGTKAREEWKRHQVNEEPVRAPDAKRRPAQKKKTREQKKRPVPKSKAIQNLWKKNLWQEALVKKKLREEMSG